MKITLFAAIGYGRTPASTSVGAAIPQSALVIPVHCSGTACDTSTITRIADIYTLKVNCDAAHASRQRHACCICGQAEHRPGAPTSGA
ncbi:DegT/DnrJ/EryC1/StrS family aminotransferase [Xanthomonas fragariae]|nr:DegT/DnrJ/EryC1/StrS family aminotransferase [Xanthomonas fragariae]